MADMDRLFRPENPADYAILQVFKETGAIIYSGDIEYNLRSSSGLLFSHIRAAISGFERQLFLERITGACDAKRRQGRCPTNAATLPLGVSYDRKEEKFVWTPEIVKVQNLFMLFDRDGITNYRELQRITGINHATIRNILSNELYIGWRTIDERRGEKRVSRSGKPYRVKVKRAPGDIIRVRVFEDAAIDPVVFARVQSEMKRVKFNHIQRFRQNMNVNLVVGIGVCGICGEPLYCSSGNRNPKKLRHGYYMCKSNHYEYKSIKGGCPQPNLSQPSVDAAVMTLLNSVLTNPASLTAMINASISRRSKVVIQLPGSTPLEFADAIRKREERLVLAYETGDIELPELRHRRALLRKELENCVGGSGSVNSSPEVGVSDTARRIVKGALRFKSLSTPIEQKAVLRGLFSEIHIKGQLLVAFRPQSWDGLSSIAAVELPQPIPVGEIKEILPGDKRRCRRCREIKTLKDFYSKANTCKQCANSLSRLRYQKKRKGLPDSANGEVSES
jgi:hypothetical protein